ncbi:hypothetical protein A6R68_19920, partial [Neotoma lepida]
SRKLAPALHCGLHCGSSVGELSSHDMVNEEPMSPDGEEWPARRVSQDHGNRCCTRIPELPHCSGLAMAVSITLKTLQQQTFKICMEPEETVKVLKEKIEAEKGRDAFPVAGQKLIFAGKILNDDVPIKEYHIDEKNFVVVMVTKAKAGQGAPAPPEVSLTAALESSTKVNLGI